MFFIVHLRPVYKSHYPIRRIFMSYNSIFFMTLQLTYMTI